MAADGARYFEALKDISFDMEGYDDRKPEAVADWMIEAVFDNFLESFEEPVLA